MDPRYPDDRKYKMPSYRETVGEALYKERETAFMKQNHTEYLKKSLMIGFTHSFPEDKSKVIDEMSVTLKCRGYDVTFKVRYGAVTFGDGDKYSCSGITTDRCEVPRPGPMAGWGSHAYADEAETMELAVVQMATKHNLMICDKKCSWPHAKAIVQPIEEAHVRCLELKEICNV